jgi:hypothetical protein
MTVRTGRGPRWDVTALAVIQSTFEFGFAIATNGGRHQQVQHIPRRAIIANGLASELGVSIKDPVSHPHHWNSRRSISRERFTAKHFTVYVSRQDYQRSPKAGIEMFISEPLASLLRAVSFLRTRSSFWVPSTATRNDGRR